MYIYGKKFYRTLEELGSTRANFPVVIQNFRYKNYTSFSSYNLFYDWYKTLTPREKTFAEMIVRPSRKIAIDIDGDWTSSDQKPDLEVVINDITNFFLEHDLGKPELIVYDIGGVRGGLRKCSYHLVISSHVVSDPMIALAMVKDLVGSSKDPWVKLVDLGVYKTRQGFRLEGSRKWDEPRWKYRVDHDGISDRDTFRQGMLSSTQDLIPVHYQIPVHQRTKMVPSLGRDCEQIPKDFVIRRNQYPKEGIILLDRVRSGMCPRCSRIHDHENGMMVYGRFVCFREVS